LLALIGEFNGANTVARQQELPRELLLELRLLALPLLELLLPRDMSEDLPTGLDPQSPGQHLTAVQATATAQGPIRML